MLTNVGYLLLAFTVLGGAVVAVLAENLIRAAVALGIGGISLAMLFFVLNAPYAGSFELSVGAGLISVLFILAISLTESMGRQRDVVEFVSKEDNRALFRARAGLTTSSPNDLMRSGSAVFHRMPLLSSNG